MSRRVPVARIVATGRFFLAVAIAIAGYLGLAADGRLADLDTDGIYAMFRQTRWGHFLGIPIATLGTAVYGALFLLSGGLVAGRPAWMASLGIGLALITTLAAIYFLLLQQFFVGGLCAWCGIAHGLAVGGACLLLAARIYSGQESNGTVRDAVSGFAFASAAIAVLMVVQSQQDSEELSVTVTLDPNRVPIATTTMDLGAGKLISLYNGRMSINPDHFPVTGSLSAENFIIVVTDYTSAKCRRLQRQLSNLQRAVGEKLAIVELPGPGSNEATLIHRSLLALREVSPNEFTALSERIYGSEHLGKLTHQHIMREVLKRVPTDEFHAVQHRFSKQIDQRIAVGRQLQQANAVQTGTTDLPQVIIGSEVLGSNDTEPDLVAEAIRRNLGFSLPVADEQRSTQPQTSPPSVELEASTIRLGKVGPGTEIPVTIRVTNGGELPLIISWVRFEKDCHLVAIPRAPDLCGEIGRCAARRDHTTWKTRGVRALTYDPQQRRLRRQYGAPAGRIRPQQDSSVITHSGQSIPVMLRTPKRRTSDPLPNTQPLANSSTGSLKPTLLQSQN